MTLRNRTRKEVEGIPIVSEFLEVFEEFLGMPPEIEIKFAIDLELGIVPVYRAPYGKSQLGLKELKNSISGVAGKRVH